MCFLSKGKHFERLRRKEVIILYMNVLESKTGYPSKDKPWLKYYKEEEINTVLSPATIYEFLWDNNKDHLNEIAINYYDNLITYKELFENIEKAASAFYRLGVRKGDIVIMATLTTPETVYAFYGLNRLGAISNMVDPRTSVDGIKTYIDEVNAKYVLCLDAALPKIIAAIENSENDAIVISVSPKDSLSKEENNTAPNRKSSFNEQISANSVIQWKEFFQSQENIIPEYAPYEKESCCIIVHTGGTTGFPKGVMLSNENLNEMVLSWRYNKLSFERKNILLSIMPPFIAYGIVNGVHVVLSCGMQIVMVPKFNPDQIADLVLKYKPTNMLATPTHYDGLLSSDLINDSTDLSFIKLVGIGGDGLHINNEIRLNEFFEKHKCYNKVTKGYGMTEVSASSCANHPENNPSGSVGLPFLKNIISAFKPGTDIELPFGETGEICIYSPSTMLGYYDNPEETDKVLKVHSDGKKWIHSGDLGYVREDGNVYIQGRIKRMVIRHDGFKVFPAQVEKAIMNSDSINNCCVVGTKDMCHSQGNLPLAFVVKTNDCEKKDAELKNELQKLCEESLPEYAVPVDYRFIDQLPVTPIGKINYRLLEKAGNNELNDA